MTEISSTQRNIDADGACRAIRSIEKERRKERSEGPPDPAAYIIALTGLASSRDQTEAYNSGVDLFMTKPASFREVGKLLDNWVLSKSSSPVEKPS